MYCALFKVVPQKSRLTWHVIALLQLIEPFRIKPQQLLKQNVSDKNITKSLPHRYSRRRRDSRFELDEQVSKRPRRTYTQQLSERH